MNCSITKGEGLVLDMKNNVLVCYAMRVLLAKVSCGEERRSKQGGNVYFIFLSVFDVISISIVIQQMDQTMGLHAPNHKHFSASKVTRAIFLESKFSYFFTVGSIETFVVLENKTSYPSHRKETRKKVFCNLFF